MSIKIPLFDLNYDQQEERAVVETLRSKWISTGPKNLEFERTFSSMFGIKHSLALANCTSALHLALRITGVSKDDEVIVPSLTFIATVNAIKFVNATPVFCDIESIERPLIDPGQIEKLITPNTKAIIVMHYAGFPCDMDSILSICKRYNLKLIEDACHGPLSQYNGKLLGTYGDVGCFSFFSNKNLSTGEGGMLVTDNSDYYEKAKLLRSHGMTSLSYERSKGHSTSYDVVDIGYNYRMDDIRASIGITQLNKLENDITKRSIIRKEYIKQLENVDEVVIPFKDHESFCSNYIFPIVLNKKCSLTRDYIRQQLLNHGIQTSIHYPAVHLFGIYNDHLSILPETEYFSNNEITLPLYSSITKKDVAYICDSLKSILSESYVDIKY